MHLPPVAHVIPLTTLRRARKLPVPGTIIVQVNERVRALDTVAECEPAPKHHFFDLARALGIQSREVYRYLQREHGDRLEKGDIIAGPVGLTRRTVRAPSRGRIVAIRGEKVLFEAPSEPLRLRAGFPGIVVSTDGTQTIAIETTGALIQAVWGNDRSDYGVMRIVGEGPAGRLMTDQLDIELRGAVLVAGVCDHPAPLQQARELSIRGLILGGLSAELIPIARKLPYAIVVVEGFGIRPINAPTYELLLGNQGREVAINGRPKKPYDPHRPEVIIPLPVTNPLDMPPDLIPLTPGVRVRILSDPHQGKVGGVEKVLPDAVNYPSGILARSVRIKLEREGSVVVPIANVEVLE